MTFMHDDLDLDYVAAVFASMVGMEADELADAVIATLSGVGRVMFAHGGPADQWQEGTAADLCWRCDSAAAQSDIGLCMDCRNDLTQETT